METALAQPALFVAYADAAPVVLRDIEDLHDADLDLVLADRLADSLGATTTASALAELVLRPGSALMVHDLQASSALLAG
ncbi:hypothetical protein E4P40_14365 [Blastococcus sp. CT_GayMR20]|uniref:hypothetical protein n=1 Tax=Blastococcus sp. CT_GayMR20 TaxID=2559609 RepID=UPI001072F512|nr:hypothetical protein [Blastococcus sp. CT_GayMR20]TFV83352.1 hypothetical protein E4P40_14365 [Blastococcus sp. CT_GayMR20]